MGDPRKLRKKYAVPRVIWDSDRIAEERGLVNEFGLKNIKEVWIAKAVLRKIRLEYRNLLALGEKGLDQTDALLQRVKNLGYLGASATVDDLLSLTTRNVLERRFQTVVHRKGLGRTVKQARQLITHGFISINSRKVTIPSYQVPIASEGNIAYYKQINIEIPEVKDEKLKETIENLNKKSDAVAEPAKDASNRKTK